MTINLGFETMLDDLQRETCSVRTPDWAGRHAARHQENERTHRRRAGLALRMEISQLREARLEGWPGLCGMNENNEACLVARLPDGRIGYYNAFTRSHADRVNTWRPVVEHLEAVLFGRIKVRRPNGIEALPEPIRAVLSQRGLDPDAVETLGFYCGGIHMTIGTNTLKADRCLRNPQARMALLDRMASDPDGITGHDVDAAMPALDPGLHSWGKPVLVIGRSPRIALEHPNRLVAARPLPSVVVGAMNGRSARDVVDEPGLAGFVVTAARTRAQGFVAELVAVRPERDHG